MSRRRGEHANRGDREDHIDQKRVVARMDPAYQVPSDEWADHQGDANDQPAGDRSGPECLGAIDDGLTGVHS